MKCCFCQDSSRSIKRLQPSSPVGARVSDDLYEDLTKAHLKKIHILENVVPAARGFDYLTMAKLKLMEGKVIVFNSIWKCWARSSAITTVLGVDLDDFILISDLEATLPIKKSALQVCEASCFSGSSTEKLIRSTVNLLRTYLPLLTALVHTERLCSFIWCIRTIDPLEWLYDMLINRVWRLFLSLYNSDPLHYHRRSLTNKWND